MRKKSNSVFLSFFCISLFLFEFSYAQNGPVTFPSSELQQMALRYSGNSLNWPVLVNLADHDIPSNSFTLTQADLLQLESFSEISTSVSENEEKIKGLISSGATIFAREELNQANSLIKNYIDAVQTGEIDTAMEIGASIPEAVILLETILNSNRLVQIQAQLNDKTGSVDKRLGLLGGWEDAFVGDLFKESDGLRTLLESYASLGFTDGSSITVEPNTVAIIRKSRIDKLDESADTEISLVQGGLLAKLSAAGKERSKYILNAGASTSELKTQNFYAESDGQETVKLTNYDGTANVSANDVTITIRKNEGTIVREGEPPAPPIELLPAPELAWGSKDTIVYNQSIIFPFNRVEDAVSYRIEYSSSSSFSADIAEIPLTSNSARISDLPLGTTYIRVQAIDNLGLRGPFSEVTRVIRNVDNQPPAIFLEEISGNIVFTLENSFLIQGITEPDARVEIENVRVPVQASGRFIYQLQNLGVDQTVSIKSIDGSGNVNESRLRIVRLTEDALFNLSLTGSVSGNTIRVSQPTVTMSSRAYPEMEIIIFNKGTTRTVQTDSQGRWGITMNMQEGELSITFKGIRSGVNYLTKSFTVQAN